MKNEDPNQKKYPFQLTRKHQMHRFSINTQLSASNFEFIPQFAQNQIYTTT